MTTRAVQIVVAVALIAVAFALRGRGPRSAVETGAAPALAPQAAPDADAPGVLDGAGRRLRAWITGVLSRGGTVALPETPEAAVTALYEAAERGDDETYLGLVSGDLRRSLRATREQVGAEAFRESLRQLAAGIKGLAVARAGAAPPGLVALDVELVFADRQERQRLIASPEGSGWVIVSMGLAERTTPAVPYGTPVVEE